jgi:hypothetical protein
LTTWNWIQPGDRVWRVVSDYIAGTIRVYDDKGKLILKKKNLSEQAIKMIEQNFLGVVAENGEKPKKDTELSMYV